MNYVHHGVCSRVELNDEIHGLQHQHQVIWGSDNFRQPRNNLEDNFFVKIDKLEIKSQ